MDKKKDKRMDGRNLIQNKLLTFIIFALICSMNTAWSQSTSKPEVLPMQVLDLNHLSNEDRNKWIVVHGLKDMPVIVEVRGANSEEFFTHIGKTMRGLQHGGLSNLVLVQSKESPGDDLLVQEVWIYVKGKVYGILEKPAIDTGTKALLQKKVMQAYDKVHGTQFYPYKN